MSERDVRLFLGDILEGIEKIESSTKGLSFEAFCPSGTTREV